MFYSPSVGLCLAPRVPFSDTVHVGFTLPRSARCNVRRPLDALWVEHGGQEHRAAAASVACGAYESLPRPRFPAALPGLVAATLFVVVP